MPQNKKKPNPKSQSRPVRDSILVASESTMERAKSLGVVCYSRSGGMNCLHGNLKRRNVTIAQDFRSAIRLASI